MGKLAEAYVEIASRTKGFDDGIKGSEQKLEAFVDKSNSLLSSIGIGLSIGGVISLIKGAADASSNLSESVNKAEVAFGKASGRISKFSDEMAEKLGLVKSTTLDAAAGFGMFAQTAGMSQVDSARFAEKFVRIAADASSLYNVTLPDALQKLQSGLSGEAEPLRQLNVFLSEAKVEAEGAAMGFKKVNGALSEGDKILARASVITRELAKAQGDAARTADEYAAAQRRLASAWTNLQAASGMDKALAGGMGGLADAMNAMSRGDFGGAMNAMGGMIMGLPKGKPPAAAAEGTGIITASDPRMSSLLNPMAGDAARYKNSIFGGGGLAGPFGMMGTLGMQMNQELAISGSGKKYPGIDRQIGELQNEGWASGHAFKGGSLHQTAQEAILDTSKDKQIKELQDIKKVLEDIKENTVKNVISNAFKVTGRE